jgi:hypothetical protein
MKTRIKTKALFSVLFVLFAFTANLNAQNSDKHTEHREKLKKEKMQFIETKLQLTETEKKNFMTVYEEYDKKREDLHRQRHMLFKNYKNNGLNMADAEILTIADKIVGIDASLSDLQTIYLEKFKKILPPVKILLLFQTENEFKKELLRKMKEGKADGPACDE